MNRKNINKFILWAILKIRTVQKMALCKVPSRYLKNKTNLEELEIIGGSVLHIQRRSCNELILCGLGDTTLH